MTVSSRNMETRESGSVTTVSCGTRAGPLSDKSHKSIPCIQFGKKRVRCTFESGSLKTTAAFFLLGASQHWKQMLFLNPSYHRGAAFRKVDPLQVSRGNSQSLCVMATMLFVLTNDGMLSFCRTIKGWPLQTAFGFLSSSCGIWRDARQQMSGSWRRGTYPQWLCGKVKSAGKWMKLENTILIKRSNPGSERQGPMRSHRQT